MSETTAHPPKIGIRSFSDGSFQVITDLSDPTLVIYVREDTSNPWRYPSRGEFPTEEKLYQTTCISRDPYDVQDSYWVQDQHWRDGEWQMEIGPDVWSGGHPVYAWRELPEPAPELEK